MRLDTRSTSEWDALCVYATQGFLAIDNNAAERGLKRVAIGRENWLFAGNDRAGRTAATLYCLIASAERHGVDPQRYPTERAGESSNYPGRLIGAVPPRCVGDE